MLDISRICYLLVPVVMPLVPLLGMFFIPQTQRRRRLITGGLLFTLIFSLLAAGLQGDCLLGTLDGLEISLLGTSTSATLSVTLAGLLALAGIFGFEVLDSQERRYYMAFLGIFSAVQATLCVGNLPLFLAGWLIAVLCGDVLVRRAPKGLSLYRIGTLVSGILLLAGAVLTGTNGLSLSFLPHETVAVPALPALLLILGFALHALVCQFVPVAAPTTVVLHVGLSSMSLFGVVQVILNLFGADTLMGSPVQTLLPPVFLMLALVAGAAALRCQTLIGRLRCLAMSQSGLVLFGLCTLQEDLFTGAFLLLVFGDLCITALLLCAAAFRYTQGKILVRDLEGIGRQMPLALFCFGCAAFGLVGLPPFVGSVSRFYMARGALVDLNWGMAAAVVLLILCGLAALALLRPLSRGFFPGEAYEPDTKLHYGPCVGLPIAVLTCILLVAGLLPLHLLHWVQSAGGLFG